jgi:uncharacterized protein (DUF849 family)
MVHIHARDEKGAPTYKKEVYEDIISRIKEKNEDIIVGVSTSGRDFSEFEKRSEVLDIKGDLKPDMASLTLSSLNFIKTASVNSPDMIKALAQKMLDNNIKPELEAFDIGMINYAKYLIKKELLKPPFYFNLLLGNIACAQATLLDVGIMLNELPDNSIWSLAGIGDCQLSMTSLGVVWGGGVRTGMEDNIWYDEERTKLATNEEMVKRIVDTTKAIGREIATPQEVRKLLNL